MSIIGGNCGPGEFIIGHGVRKGRLLPTANCYSARWPANHSFVRSQKL